MRIFLLIFIFRTFFQRLQQEMNMLCAEDNLNDKKLKLITQKQQLQQNTRENEPLHSRYRNAIKGLSAAEDDLTTELKRVRILNHSSPKRFIAFIARLLAKSIFSNKLFRNYK